MRTRPWTLGVVTFVWMMSATAWAQTARIPRAPNYSPPDASHRVSARPKPSAPNRERPSLSPGDRLRRATTQREQPPQRPSGHAREPIHEASAYVDSSGQRYAITVDGYRNFENPPPTQPFQPSRFWFNGPKRTTAERRTFSRDGVPEVETRVAHMANGTKKEAIINLKANHTFFRSQEVTADGKKVEVFQTATGTRVSREEVFAGVSGGVANKI
jgi:hypothetical protein